MDTSQHVIQSAKLNARIRGRESALKRQDELSMIFRDILTDVLEDVFSEFNTPERVIIDKLEVNLDRVSLTDEDSIKQRFKNRLKSAIIKTITEQKTRTITKEVSIFSVFEHFIREGYLPWNTLHQSFRELTVELSKTEKWSQYWINTIFSFLSEEHSRKRIFYQSDIEFLKTIISRVLKHEEIQDLDSLDKTQLANVIGRLVKTRRVEKQTDLDHYHENGQNMNGLTLKEDLLGSSKKLDREDDLIYTKFAGVVLLNPVIPALFSKLGYTNKSGFKTPKFQERAVFLLNHLVTGEEEIDENDSVVFKLLSGMDIHEVIPPKLELNQEEMDTCVEALETIIKEWGALKGTSVDAFRENFLMRSANLKKQGGAFEMYVQQESVDVIMKFNPPPWTVGFIKFPWMKNTIHVTWY